jgi:hypothetical protein
VRLPHVMLSGSCALMMAACSSQESQTASTSNQQTEEIATESNCPDNPRIDLRDCEFARIKTLLKPDESAHDRYRKAATKCGEFDQVTINFCFGALQREAERELVEAYAYAKPSPSVAEYVAWKSKIGQICTPEYPPEEGGSGYSSRVTYCNMTKYSEKIDMLKAEGPRR